MKKILSRLNSSRQDQVDIEMGRLRNQSKKYGNMLRNKQNLRAIPKFESLTEQDDKVPYETMATILILAFLIFLVAVHFMIEWELDGKEHIQPKPTSCCCQN